MRWSLPSFLLCRSRAAAQSHEEFQTELPFSQTWFPSRAIGGPKCIHKNISDHPAVERVIPGESVEFQALIRGRDPFNRALRFPLQSGKIDFSAPIGRIGRPTKNYKDSEGLAGQLPDKLKRRWETKWFRRNLGPTLPRGIAFVHQRVFAPALGSAA